MYREVSATLGVICPLITCVSFYHCKSSIKPSLSITPPPQLISHPLFKGRKFKNASPSLSSLPSPPPFLFFTNEWYTVLINHDLKTSIGLILNDLFTCWKFGFIFNPRLKWPPISCTWAYPLCILVYGELIKPSSLNQINPTPLNKAPPPFF